MTKRAAPKSFIEQLADLDDPAPKDFDPEDDGAAAQGSDSSADSGDNDATEARRHYETVGKSRLRKPEELPLGPGYTGSRISRHALLEDDSDDDPFGQTAEGQKANSGQSEESAFSDPEIDGHIIEKKPTYNQSDEELSPQDDEPTNPEPSPQKFEADLMLSASGDESLSSDPVVGDDAGSDYSKSSSDAPSLNGSAGIAQSAQREQLRKMMAESQRTVLSNISAAAKADAAKGKAIKQQRSTFDSLLNTRIKLQKALVAANSLSITSNTPAAATDDRSSNGADNEAIKAAERAAVKLWNTIDSLRTTLRSSTPPTPATPSTPTSTLWTRTHAHDTLSLPLHRATLTKWSNKINPPPLLTRNKFSQPPTQQPLTSVLDQHTSGTQAQKHLDRARTPRSCAPLQASKKILHDGGIYDDADFYTLLLRELVDQRMADQTSAAAGAGAGNARPPLLLPGMKDRALRVKKNVDTKASKGRKMRYTVHEKLQNFMAPEDRGRWGERQREELFSGLLGRRVEMDEDEDGMDVDGEEEDEDRREEEALMLFRRS